MASAVPERNFDQFTAVKLTDAHNRLGQIVDDCQREPVILQKHQRPRAAIVSMEFLEHALEALHGYREVITTETMTDEQKAHLEAARPSAEEIAADKWDDERDPITEAGRRSKLRLPIQA
ncbi:MAG: type II toxin-antitoxin system Phd/YefM family antitoxin [Tardiphaga sp.]|nr:type II toxin-antitoxin system Phd/YefM family antitoxin [Tardiphaga sp.]